MGEEWCSNNSGNHYILRRWHWSCVLSVTIKFQPLQSVISRAAPRCASCIIAMVCNVDWVSHYFLSGFVACLKSKVRNVVFPDGFNSGLVMRPGCVAWWPGKNSHWIYGLQVGSWSQVVLYSLEILDHYMIVRMMNGTSLSSSMN